jgi:hypothetical protein
MRSETVCLRVPIFTVCSTRVLRLPVSVEERPALEFIQWHNEHVFLG